jgi:hypothetical protein
MDLPNESKGKWETASHPFEAMVQRRYIVRDLLHVIQRDTWCLFVLIKEQI